MSACFDEESWFVTIEGALKNLDDEQSRLKDNSNHSIREIVNHLIYWNERYLKRFRGAEPGKAAEDNSGTFTDEFADTENMDWKSALKKLYDVFSQMKKFLDEADAEKLNTSPFKGRSENLYILFAHINIHNAYHIGQIVTLRKVHGNWDDKYGVK